MPIVKPPVTVVLAPPDNLTILCSIDKPPKDLSKDSLVKAWTSQTINLGNCNKQVKGIKEWKQKVLEVKGVK